jgi:hypothetical protein
MANYISLDFEFKDTTADRSYTVVCACTKVGTEEYQWWLYDGNTQPFLTYFHQKAIKEGLPVNCHYAHAEVTCLLSLGVDLDQVNFIDTFVESKLVQNTDDKRVQKYLSLAALAKYFNIFDYYQDDYKDQMRRLIVKTSQYNDEQKQQIMDYCSIDTRVSHQLLPLLMNWHRFIFGSYPSQSDVYKRGNYVKAAAHASWVGIKLCPNKLKSIEKNHSTLSNQFVDQASKDVRDCYIKKDLYYSLNRDALTCKIKELGLQKKWKLTETGQYSTSSDDLKEMENYHPFISELRQTLKRISSLSYLKPRHVNVVDLSQYSEVPHWSSIVTNPDFFTRSGTIQKKKFGDYIKQNNLTWEVNDKGNYVTSKDAFDRYYSFEKNHDDKLLSIYKDMQIIQLWKNALRNTLDGTEEDETTNERSTLHTETTIDGNLHMAYGVFGTTTGRNAPKARLFLFAQAAWQRSLVDIPKNHVLVTVDYASAEILIGSHVYEDNEMYEAFKMSDYYLTSGVAMGVVSKEDYDNMDIEDLKEKYKNTRKMLKTLVLGLNYGMGAPKLGKNLFPDEAEYKATKKARNLIDKYKKVYYKFFRTSQKFVNQSGKPTRWGHWGHIGLNSATTAGNFYIQATGALVLHNAMIRLANKSMWRKGIYLFCPLHDAIYFYVKNDDKRQQRIDLALREMANAKKDALGNPNAQIKMEYKICQEDETFFEKDLDTVERVHQLIGHSYKLMDSTEYTKIL